MKKIFFVILLITLFSGLFAQEYSKLKAMAFSVVLPGTGELYTKKYNKAATFFVVELATVFAYLRLKNETEWATNSFQQFANSNAEVPINSDDEYYQQIQDYESSDAYNENIILAARNYFLNYKNDPEGYENYLANNLISGNQEWDWGTERNWVKYQNMRRTRQNLLIYTKFTFAAAILNRLVSMVDSAISARNANNEKSVLSNLKIKPDWQRKGFQISYEHKF